MWANAVNENSPPCLSHANSIDAEGYAFRYWYEVYGDSLMSSLVAQAGDYPQIVGGTTTWVLSEELSQGEAYYWPVSAGDGFEYGPWSPLASFVMPYGYVCGDAAGDASAGGAIGIGDAVYLIA